MLAFVIKWDGKFTYTIQKLLFNKTFRSLIIMFLIINSSYENPVMSGQEI